jgi:hypothetical protein
VVKGMHKRRDLRSDRYGATANQSERLELGCHILKYLGVLDCFLHADSVIESRVRPVLVTVLIH